MGFQKGDNTIFTREIFLFMIVCLEWTFPRGGSEPEPWPPEGAACFRLAISAKIADLPALIGLGRC